MEFSPSVKKSPIHFTVIIVFVQNCQQGDFDQMAILFVFDFPEGKIELVHPLLK